MLPEATESVKGKYVSEAARTRDSSSLRGMRAQTSGLDDLGIRPLDFLSQRNELHVHGGLNEGNGDVFSCLEDAPSAPTPPS